jgi:hypothetical protein
VSRSLLASSCIGCPTSTGHGAVIALALILILLGAAGYVLLGRGQPVLGRVVGGLFIVVGLLLLIVQP